jgi:hypothetical protein
MALPGDPTLKRSAGERNVLPNACTAQNNHYLQPAVGYTPTDCGSSFRASNGRDNSLLAA